MKKIMTLLLALSLLVALGFDFVEAKAETVEYEETPFTEDLADGYYLIAGVQVADDGTTKMKVLIDVGGRTNSLDVIATGEESNRTIKDPENRMVWYIKKNAEKGYTICNENTGNYLYVASRIAVGSSETLPDNYYWQIQKNSSGMTVFHNSNKKTELNFTEKTGAFSVKNPAVYQLLLFKKKDTSGGLTYKVKVEWTGMTFNYHEGDKVWNPDILDVVLNNPEWKSSDGGNYGTITLTNESKSENLTARFSFKGDGGFSDYGNVDMIFSTSSDTVSSGETTIDVPLSSTGDPVKVYTTPNGLLEKMFYQPQTMGTIKIEIILPEAPVPEGAQSDQDAPEAFD